MTDPTEKLESLVQDLGMPSGYKPPSKKVVAARYKADKVHSTPGELALQLRAYESEIASDPAQVRNYVTNKLIEISGCGDVKNELKALELLGKITNVGLFSERNEITVKHTTSGDLEAAIKERIKKLLDHNTIDVTPEEEIQETLEASEPLQEQIEEAEETPEE